MNKILVAFIAMGVSLQATDNPAQALRTAKLEKAFAQIQLNDKKPKPQRRGSVDQQEQFQAVFVANYRKTRSGSVDSLDLSL